MPRTRSADSGGRLAALRSPLFLPVAVVLAIWVIFGGSAPEGVLLFTVLALSGTALTGLLLARGDAAVWRTLPWSAQVVLVLFCLIPLLQLVPLPPVIWQALPGRELAVASLVSAGRGDAWHPLSLSIEATWRSALVTIWLAVLFLSLLHLSSAELRRVFLLLFCLGILNVAVGIVQVLSGSTLLQLYEDLKTPFLSGLFANKNHTGLFFAITFLTGYAAFYSERGWNTQRVAFAAPVVLILFVALLATFSRAGVIFGLVAVMFLALLSINKQLRGATLYLTLGAPIVGLALVLLISSTDLAARALARFGGINDDLRWSIWTWSWPLVTAHLPTGGGVGSFTALFPPHEQLAWVKPTYVNHIHNDYLEQLLEIGFAAPLLWLLMIVMFVRPLRQAWRNRMHGRGRLALIGGAMLFLVAIHSSFDYPLRRPAIAATCMVAAAALLRGRGRDGVELPVGRPTRSA